MEVSTNFWSMGSRAQEAMRTQAVEVVKAGMGKSKAAEVFGVSRRAVWRWVRADRRQGGKEPLKATNRVGNLEDDFFMSLALVVQAGKGLATMETKGWLRESQASPSFRSGSE